MASICVTLGLLPAYATNAYLSGLNFMTREERICRYLSACPPAISGSNGHGQTFSIACNLYNGFAMTQQELEYWLSQYNTRCQPPWSERELAHKVQQAMNAQHSRPRGCLIEGNGSFSKQDFNQTSFQAKPVEKPKTDPQVECELFLKGFRCSEADLWEASPVKPGDDFTSDGTLLISKLYKRGEIINFVTEFRMDTMKDGSQKATPVGYGSSIERDQLICDWSLGAMPDSKAGGWMRMNPVDGKGIKDSNVTSFRFILCEFDQIPLDLQISLFARLPLPIAVILTSGGKSVHAWVKTDSSDITCYRDDAAMLLKMLDRFGMDTKNKNPARLSRLVGCRREIGASGDGRQRILYLNPNPDQRRIIQ